MTNLFISLLILLIQLYIVTYYIYIFTRFKRLRLKKWFFNESFLRKYHSRLVVKYFLRKITFTYTKKLQSSNMYLKHRYYIRLRWKKKPSISSVVFISKNIKTIVIIISFR